MRHRGAVFCITLSVLAAAGGFSPASADESVTGTIRIAWWGGPTRHAKTNAVVDLFQAAYPNVKVEREMGEFTAYWDKLAVQAAGGNQPCVIQMQSRFSERFARANVLRPLNDLIQSGALKTEGIAPGVMATAQHLGGNQYFMPYGVFLDALAFNRTFFEKGGVEPPTIDWRWEDFVARAKALQPTLPEGVVATDLLGGNPQFFFPYVIGRGEKVFDENGVAFGKQTMIDWYEMWEDMRKAGVTESADRMTELGLRTVLEDRPLSRATSAMGFGALNQLGPFQNSVERVGDYRIDLQKLPNGPKGPGDVIGSNGFSIGATCPDENLPAATAFINFFNYDPEGAKIFASDNGLVTVPSLREAQANDPQASYALRRQVELMAAIEEFVQPEAYPPYYGEIRELMFSNYQAVAFETMSIEDAVDEFFAAAAAIAKK
jgi:multiple sugar transport system substrate-binding protein